MRLHNRQIKAAFWTDTELIRELPPEGRLFYLGLIQLADDSGCLEDDIMAFKIFLFPGDAGITEERLSEFRKTLVRMGKLIPYLSEDKPCLFLKNFHKHQTIKNPSPPEVPLPEWIKWEPYSSNPRTGKYVVSRPSDECKKTVRNASEDPVLQSSSNLNLNQNLKISTNIIVPPDGGNVPLKDPNDGKNISSEEPDSDKDILPGSPVDGGDASPAKSNGNEKAFLEESDGDEDVPPKSFRKLSYTAEHMAIAEHLKDRILENKPDARVPKHLDAWANTARLMMEIDKRPREKIIEVIDWCQRDEFWRSNILSMDKLRKQFDRLELQMAQGRGARSGRGGSYRRYPPAAGKYDDLVIRDATDLPEA